MKERKVLKNFILVVMMFLVFGMTACSEDNKAEHTVKYDDLNGTVYEIVVEDGEKLVEYQVPKAGYIFEGWYTDKEFKNKYNFKNGVSEDLELFAKYNKAVTVKYDDLKGNVYETIVSVNSKAPEYTLKNEELAFVGWFMDKELTQKFNFETLLQGDITLYAKFTEGKYTVTYINGGESFSQKYLDGDVVKEYTLEKEGYVFDGWYLDEELTIKYDFSKVITSDITLYAKFTVNGTLQTIEDSEIFKMEEKSYYVFFVKDTCPYCEKARPEVIKYNTLVTSGAEEYSDNLKVYQVYVKKGSYKSVISRAYSNVLGNGQGTDGKYFVDGVTEWDKLYIGSAPSLILISEVDGVKTAKYITQGKTNIVNYLNNELK